MLIVSLKTPPKSADLIPMAPRGITVGCERMGRFATARVMHLASRQNSSWWMTQLDLATRRGKSFLRRHFPGISNAHEDIVSETKTQLVEQVLGNSREYPASWYSEGGAAGGEADYFFQLFNTILKRRVADHFRERSLSWAREIDIESVPESELSAPSGRHDVQIMHERLMKLCVEFINEMPNEDRTVLWRLIDASSEVKGLPLTDSERQRLHRLRKRLRAVLLERLGGDTISALLSE